MLDNGVMQTETGNMATNFYKNTTNCHTGSESALHNNIQYTYMYIQTSVQHTIHKMHKRYTT